MLKDTNMKISIRARFTLGMAFFFVIIAGLSILSAYHLNRLSQKTDAILKENHFSVIFARDIALSFTFNFASYFNERFSKLYNGIKEIGSSNYSQRLNFEGEDEFYDISLVFNDMAKNLEENKQNPKTNLEDYLE